MPEALLLREEADGVALLTLNRPDKRNALSRRLRDQIVQSLEALEQRDAVRAVILTAAGAVFCAGFDRAEFEGGQMAEIFRGRGSLPPARVHVREAADRRGQRVSAGWGLRPGGDVRRADRGQTAVFGQPQVRFGAGAAYDLMRTVLAAGAAREMCLSGRRYEAGEALEIGLVNRVVEPGELLATARALPAEIAVLPEGVPESLKRSFLENQPPLFGSSEDRVSRR